MAGKKVNRKSYRIVMDFRAVARTSERILRAIAKIAPRGSIVKLQEADVRLRTVWVEVDSREGGE